MKRPIRQRNVNRRLTVALVVVACLAGCKSDADQTRAEGTGVGALIGAAGGAIIGGLAGGGKGAAIGAGIGAVAGGVGGYAYGDSVAKEKARYVSNEAYLNDRISKAQQSLSRAKADNEQLAVQIRDMEQQRTRLAAMAQANDSGYVEAARNYSASLGSMSQSTKDQLNALDREIAYEREAVKQSQTASASSMNQLNQRIAELESEKSRLEQQRGQIAQLAIGT